VTQDASFWTLPDEGFAQLAVGAVTALVDPPWPNRGLSHVRVNDQVFDAMTARLLVITPQDDPPIWHARLVDRYVRGNDLVATYTGNDSWPYAPQIYWSAEPEAADGAALGSLSVVVSIQTNLLDTHPRVFVRSGIPADELLMVRVSGRDTIVDTPADGVQLLDAGSSAHGLVWRLPGGEMSYAEMMPTSDIRQLEIRRGGPGCMARWELFSEFLEKGVIRRARVQSVFLPREDDVHLAAKCCRMLASRPLPLTT
jgi:hypothetical protein